MRPSFFLAAVALAAAPLHAQTAPEIADARAAIAAVLAHQASMRGPESGAATCVEGVLAGPLAAPGEEDPMVPNHAVRIGFRWHLPEQPPILRPPPQYRPDGRRVNRERRPEVPLPAALAPDVASRLDALRAEAARAPAMDIAQIDAALVPAPLRLQDGARDCGPLTLSVPAFAGDAAFIETAYACGTTCGNGSLYALQRREGRWEVVGVADIWIS
ncbi:MAG TPA: hypothetical protein VGO55_09150 [Allosphingosinicella sp.]|jgi:hypothetical protein|nr:hypothetical protein [Allosphingosinicella sp.]